ncbi:MAG: hypothetical protein FJ027_06980 [Candidatus Rokubacteria bacterium]|nr:hypothetical protein [Candidatus Rokubacteria bacterium]
MALVVMALLSGPVEAAGPWKGQILDAETDRPVPGVIVLAIWTAVKPALIHAERDFHDVDELVTDGEGRFEIPARDKQLGPLTVLDGPELLVFKAGYGDWAFRELHRNYANVRDAHFRGQAVRAEWARFEREGTAFVVEVLRGRQERLGYFYRLPWPSVPTDRIPRLMDALAKEKSYLGVRSR